MGTALRLLAVREGRSVTQEALATRVGARAKRTYSQSAAKGWLKGVVPSDLESQLALALELGVDPGWLYFFPFSEAPAPPGAEIAQQPDVDALEAHHETPIKRNRIPVPQSGAVKNPRKRSGGSK